MLDRRAIIVRNPRVEYRRLAEGGGAVLLNLDTAAYHGLNGTGSAIWEAVGEGTAIGELVPAVASLFENAPPSMPEEVMAFIEDLVARDLLRVDREREADEPSALDTADRVME